MLDPGAGTASSTDAASADSIGSGMSLKSMTFDSYINTMTMAAVAVAASLRPSEREIEISIGSKAGGRARHPMTIGEPLPSVKGPNTWDP